MAVNTPLDTDDIAWINGYAAEVRGPFSTEFGAAEDRFARWKPLLQRFTDAVDYVLKNGRGYFSAVDEAHNELCIASAILANPNPRIVRLDYEPPLPGCAKSIDFRAVAEDGTIFYVDVKTIRPVAKDRWEQYEKGQEEQWLPENVRVVLSKDWLGGEIWHSMFTARGRMLEYALELEAKIAQAKLGGDNSRLVMAFCGAGFHWRCDELEDFVSFYFSGRHRADDPFSQAELKYMAEKKLGFARTINSFACMSRPQGTIRQRPIHWNVQPPHDMFS
jgi:hypothetical protein